MARQLLFDFDGEPSAFDLTRHGREKLHGRKRKVVVDDEGRPCQRALLTEDGATLIPPGGAAELYLDAAFDVVEKGDRQAVDAAGRALEPVPSTLGVAQRLVGPVSAQRLLDHVTPVVYQLDPASLGPRLQAGLAEGGVYESRFSYVDGWDAQALFLVQNDTGVYALVGRPTGFDWVRRATPPPAEDGADLFEDDLDFGML